VGERVFAVGVLHAAQAIVQELMVFGMEAVW
jgi:hypothetical protein